MQSVSQNNTRIAKNTLALYIRQIIVMCIQLFTFRIVLQALGITDYGIQNVVGGAVVMFSFLTSTLQSVTQRFINVEMEKGSKDTLQKIFSTSLMLHIVIGVIIIFLGETAGLWFVENKLVIPEERTLAAMWVFQFALFGMFLSIISAPFTALVIAHEDMHVYGYVGIFEVIMKLAAVYLLITMNTDKLITYSALVFFISCFVTLFYNIYCQRKYSEAKFSFHYDRSVIKELGGYSGYIFVDKILYMLIVQGVNILLNMFYGPAVNAARGVAYAVDNALLSFGLNFRKALDPQLTKSCARGDRVYMWSLLERGTRISYFLILIFAVPILLKAEFILQLWLKDIPEYTVAFTQLVIIYALLEATFTLLSTIVRATGKLKAFYSVHYVYMALTLVFSYAVCEMGYPPHYVFIVPLPLLLLSIPARFIVMKKLANFSVKFFTQKALLPMFAVSVISFVPFYAANRLLTESNLHSFGIMALSMLWTGAVILYIGLRKSERAIAFDFVKRKFLQKP